MFLNTIFSRVMGIEEVQRQSIATFIGQFSFTFIGFLSTMYFAHTVGASILGAYFLFTAYYGIINIFADGGFVGAAIKRISEGVEQDAYFTAFFVIRSVFLMLVLLIMVFFESYFIDLQNSGLFNWLLLALVASLFYGSVSGGVAGSGKMGIYAAGNFVNNISRISIQVLAVYIGFSIMGLVGGFVVGLLIGALVDLRFFDLRLSKFNWFHIKNLSTFSFWLFLTSTGVMLYSYADTIMIGYFLNNSDIGIYRVIFQFTSLAVIVSTAIRATLWPKVSRWGKSNESILVEKSLSKAITYSLSFALPVVAGGVLLGDKLLYYFYGAEFENGYSVLLLLLVVQLINLFVFFFTMYLGALDHQKESFKVTAVAVVANIILNLILIPTIGIKGAAIATLITMGLNSILAGYELLKLIKISLDYNSIMGILKASLAMSVLLGSLRIMVGLSSVWVVLFFVAFGCLVYFILLLRLNKAMSNELENIAKQMNIPWPGWL